MKKLGLTTNCVENVEIYFRFLIRLLIL